MGIIKFSEAVVAFARQHVGYEEVPGNNGFKDPAFDTKMRQVGFENTWAWCALFAELCWSYPTYDNKWKVFQSISDNFSANAVRTFENFEKDDTGLFQVHTTYLPSPGDVVIWEKRRGGVPVKRDIWTLGHAGIIEFVNELTFTAIEGNTNASGGREGIEVARKVRPFNYDEKDGLILKGFITCKI